MVTIRPATVADVPSITTLANALLQRTTYEWTEKPHTVTARAAWLRDHDARGHPVLVAVDGPAIVGWAAYGDFRDTERWPGYRATVEHTVHVAERHWGVGVGRRLMARLVDVARGAGKRVMIGGIDATNDSSIRFHARLGFREVARLPGVGEKWGRRLDLVLVQRELDTPIPVPGAAAHSSLRCVPRASSRRADTGPS